jgi:hypothetical protein
MCDEDGAEIWVTTSLPEQEIEGKTVQIVDPKTGAACERGWFMYKTRPDGRVSISIQTDSRGDFNVSGKILRHHLSQSAVDSIRRNPEGAAFEFSCLGNPKEAS